MLILYFGSVATGGMSMETVAGVYSRIVFPGASSNREPHFSDLQKAMLDATPDCIKVVSTDGRLLTMNRAGCRALGVPEDSSFGMPWLSLLPEEVHPLGMEALQEAREGRNARFPGRSVSPDGTQYWDNLLTPVIDASGQVLSILCVSRDITAKTRLEKQIEDAIERERLLSREMQHRIKNLFSVVSSLIVIAEREAVSAGTPEAVTTILRDKLGALSRASDAVFASGLNDDGDVGDVDLGAVVHSVLRPYHGRCTVAGCPVTISRADMPTFALFLHELATNSLKYGALGKDEGNVTVRWTKNGEALDLTWIELGGPALLSAPERRGFGSEMVDRIVRSAGGSLTRTWCVEGLIADLHLPILPRN
ncbi:hypothetical protein ACO34A_12515 [Rhizobium sp. ACO-34A]|nr:PAS domain-containing protein [Rhizobium sp. ACO-34A]ATN34623.1 hypothetical protein ACO34A_12515 [Rhizobium sp. ACO-34A]